MVRKFLPGEALNVSIYFRGLGQTQEPGHLPRRTGYIRTAVFLFGKVSPIAIPVYTEGGKMAAHLPTGTHWIFGNIRSGVKSVEKLLGAKQVQRHHKGLVPVIATSEIPVPKGTGHRQLRQFLAIAKNPEFCLAGQYFPSPQ